MTLQVLVTRPEPGSSRTAALLRARGHQPLVLPLTRTVPLSDNYDVIRRTPAAAYVVTSAAALRHWKNMGLGPGQLSVPFYAVGEATAKSARDAGFIDVRVGPGDGDALAGMIVSDVEAGRLAASETAPLIYAAGRVRRSRIEGLIHSHKLPLRIVEIYDTNEISYSTDFVRRQFSMKDRIAVFLYSFRGATILMEHLLRRESDKVLKNCVFLCLSSHVASAIPEPYRNKTRVAAAPTEAELLIQLDRLIDVS